MLGIEGFFELVFSAYLNISGAIMSTDGEILGLILSFLCVSIALIFLPISIFVIARKKNE